MSKVHMIGIIAEDQSDYNAVKVLISRITNNDKLTFKPKIGHGCGKIKNKCLPWSNDLHNRGCNLLIVIHDLDRNDKTELHSILNKKLSTSNIQNRFICIPVEELEAWFLSDPESIKLTFKLYRVPKIKGLPETINSPKEYLETQVTSCSNNERQYLTSYNEKIAQNSSLALIRDKCPSFAEFFNFISEQSYAIK